MNVNLNCMTVDMPTVMADAIHAISFRMQVSPDLALGAVLGGCAAVCGPLADVELPGGFMQPLVLHIIGVADSGGSKSPVLAPILLELGCLEARFAPLVQKESKRYQAQYLTFSHRKKALERRIAKAEQDAVPALEVELQALLESEPTRPVVPRLLIGADATVAGLMESLAEESPCGAIITAEGAIPLKVLCSQDPTFSAERWDGDNINMRRRGRTLRTVDGTRMQLTALIQADRLQALLQPAMRQARGSGYLGRCLFIFAPSQVGMRHFPAPMMGTDPALERLFERWRALMAQMVDGESGQFRRRRLLQLSAGAQQLWLDARQQIEYAMRPGGELFDYQDFGSKMAAHIGRLAGVMSAIDGDSLIVEERHVRAAIALAWFFARQFAIAVQPPPPKPSERQIRAQRLYAFLRERLQLHGPVSMSKRDLQRLAPRTVRDAHNLEVALVDLEAAGMVRLLRDARSRALVAVSYPPVPPIQAVPIWALPAAMAGG
jgi:hypothetical protein